MDESQKQYAKQKGTNTDDYILYDPIDMTFPENANL